MSKYYKKTQICNHKIAKNMSYINTMFTLNEGQKRAMVQQLRNEIMKIIADLGLTIFGGYVVDMLISKSRWQKKVLSEYHPANNTEHKEIIKVNIRADSDIDILVYDETSLCQLLKNIENHPYLDFRYVKQLKCFLYQIDGERWRVEAKPGVIQGISPHVYLNLDILIKHSPSIRQLPDLNILQTKYSPDVKKLSYVGIDNEQPCVWPKNTSKIIEKALMYEPVTSENMVELAKMCINSNISIVLPVTYYYWILHGNVKKGTTYIMYIEKLMDRVEHFLSKYPEFNVNGLCEYDCQCIDGMYTLKLRCGCCSTLVGHREISFYRYGYGVRYTCLECSFENELFHRSAYIRVKKDCCAIPKIIRIQKVMRMFLAKRKTACIKIQSLVRMKITQKKMSNITVQIAEKCAICHTTMHDNLVYVHCSKVFPHVYHKDCINEARNQGFDEKCPMCIRPYFDEMTDIARNRNIH